MKHEKTIDKTICEKLCAEICRNFVPVSSKAAHREALLFTICREIYNYLGEDFVLTPIHNSSHLETYMWNLQMLVIARRSEYFDVRALIEKYIDETLNKSYQPCFKTSFAS